MGDVGPRCPTPDRNRVLLLGSEAAESSAVAGAPAGREKQRGPDAEQEERGAEGGGPCTHRPEGGAEK